MLCWMANPLQAQSTNVNQSNSKADQIDSLMQQNFKDENFNGTILVSQQGKPIYKNAFGYGDKANNLELDETSVFYLASLSKQFTAMAIMILKEQKKLTYEDKLSTYFPSFPGYANAITIQHLLTHTSGIPDYFKLGINKKGLTNNDVIKALSKQKKLDFKPGKKYSYSNSGYLLLSQIIEKTAGVPFHEFMETNIFKPLNMNSTLVYTKSTAAIKNRAIGYNAEGELDDYEILTTGDGGMFSTLADLHLWDQALYTEKLIKKSTLEDAFSSAVLNNGELANYGYGWNISKKEKTKLVYHAGGLAGYRSFIMRNISNHSGYIILTNNGNGSNIQEIVTTLNKILEMK